MPDLIATRHLDMRGRSKRQRNLVLRILRAVKIYAQRLLLEPLTTVRELAWSVRNGNARFLSDRAQIKSMHWNKSHPPAIFFWIPKAAGTSVAAELEQRGAQ